MDAAENLLFDWRLGKERLTNLKMIMTDTLDEKNNGDASYSGIVKFEISVCI